MNTILKTLLSNVNPVIMIIAAVMIGIWLIKHNSIGRLIDQIGGDGSKAGSWLWPVGISATAIILALILAAPETFKELSAPSVLIANTEASGYQASQTDPIVFAARKERDKAVFEAETAKEGSRKNCFNNGGVNCIKALAPAWQVLQVETDKLLDPAQKFETVKTNVSIQYEQQVVGGVPTMVPVAQTEEKSTTTRTSNPLTLIIIFGIVSAVAGAWGRKS